MSSDDENTTSTRRERVLGSMKKTFRLGRDAFGKNLDRVKTDLASAADQGSQWVNAGLATKYAHWVDSRMGHLFASRATIYDQAMDRVYLATHKWGGDHRLFDGGHDPIGAWERVSHANPDDTFLHEVGAYFTAMWKDMVTPNGRSRPSRWCKSGWSLRWPLVRPPWVEVLLDRRRSAAV